MQTGRFGQAVMAAVVMIGAGSCAGTKEYTSKLFAPRTTGTELTVTEKKTLRFLEIDTAKNDQENWVSTDVIMGRDTNSTTATLDRFAATYPAVKKDTIVKTAPVKVEPASVAVKQTTDEAETVAKSANPGEVRNKKSRDDNSNK